MTHEYFISLFLSKNIKLQKKKQVQRSKAECNIILINALVLVPHPTRSEPSTEQTRLIEISGKSRVTCYRFF